LIVIVAAGGSVKALKEVPASEVLAKIQNGQPIEYDDVLITGNLDLSKSDLPTKNADKMDYQNSNSNGVQIVNKDIDLNKYVLCMPEDIKVVRSSIKMSNSKIMGIMDFSNTLLENTIDFDNIVFNNDVHFQNTEFNGTNPVGYKFKSARFNGSADFSCSMFKSTVFFFSSTFNKDVEFWNSKFSSDAYFLNSDFNQDAEFQNSKFHRLNFYESKFNNDVHFENSEFMDNAGFSHCIFNKSIYFCNSNFNKNVEFQNTMFNGDAYFGLDMPKELHGITGPFGTRFNGDVNCIDSIFKGSADLSSSRFNGTINFINSMLNGKTTFNNSQFKDAVFFENTTFGEMLSLTGTRYDRLYIRWHDIEDLAYDDTAYLSLLENFKKLGYLEDYDSCYYDYRKKHISQNLGRGYHGLSFSEELLRRNIDFFLEWTYGYGKKPFYPVVWSIGTILFFGILWGIIEQKRREIILDEYSSSWGQVTDENPEKSQWDKICLVLEPFMFSATTFLSGTKLFVDAPEVPEILGLPRSLIKSIFNLERVLGALFFILFILAVSGTVVR